MKRVETCMHNKFMGLYGNLTFRFVLFCFANMLNYGTSSLFWAPFSLKTLLEESSPTGARQVRKTVENAGKLRKQRDRR